MGNFAGFQINQNKALQDIVIKNQINKIVFFFCMNMLLSCNKCISFSKLHNKLLQVIDNSLFKVRFMVFCALLHIQKLSDNRVSYEFKLVLIRRSYFFHLSLHTLRILCFQHSIVILRRNISLKRSCAPILIKGLFLIPLSYCFIIDLKKNTIVRPTKQSRLLPHRGNN